MMMGRPILRVKFNINSGVTGVSEMDVLFCFFPPDWCGSVGWTLSHKAKGHQFNSQSGHMRGLQVWSLVGMVQEATG